MLDKPEKAVFDYGFGEAGNQLIDLFRSGAPDFDKARDILSKGLDINIYTKDDNILSKILSGYWWSESGDDLPDTCSDCIKEDCTGCPENVNLNPNLGESMIAVICFFLENGFDVHAHNDKNGAQCLFALTWSTYDRYMIEAAKLLLDAGAKNIPVGEIDDDTPQIAVATKASYTGTCLHDHPTENIFEAMYLMYEAANQGKPYSGIDSYETAKGAKIRKVFLACDNQISKDNPFFSIDEPTSKHSNCFKGQLYFVYDNGALIIDEYITAWTDSNYVVPENATDVSEHFPGIIGPSIKEYKFQHNEVIKGTTHYGQPVIRIIMNNGVVLSFSTNYGELEKEKMVGYFQLSYTNRIRR